MGQFGFFRYLRLKLTVLLIRFMLRTFTITKPLLRDKKVADTYGIRQERIQVPSRNNNRSINVDVYFPPGLSDLSAASKTPVLVNWHGSGFIIPMHGSDVLFSARIARDAGFIVLDADYRKAPEHPFPAAVEDAEDVMRWIASQSAFDTSRVAVSGFSAGGSLALAISSTLRKSFTGVTIVAAIPIYPVTDMSIAPETRIVPKPIRPIPPFMGHLFADTYLPDKAARKDPRASPAYADLADFPPTVLVITCEGDVYGPEARALAEKLDDGKRKVILHDVKEIHHGFDKGAEEGSKAWKDREEAYALVVTTLKEASSSKPRSRL
jgi:acetyl esterase/lipase